jgi:TonB family protein
VKEQLMRDFTKRLWPIFILVVCSPGFGQVKPSTPPFSIVITTPQQMASSASALKVKAEIQNRSTHAIASAPNCAAELDVRDAAGKPVAKTDRWRQYESEQARKPTKPLATTIMPGATQECVFVVNDMYEMPDGPYSIQMERRDLDGGDAVARSNTLSLFVLAPNPPQYSIVISAAEAVVKSRSAAIVNAFFINTSSHRINLSMDEADYQTYVRDGHWDLARHTEYGQLLADREQRLRASGAASFFTIPLEPGETTKAQINLTRLFDLRQPGRYLIYVQGYDRENQARVVSNQIDLTVAQVQCTSPSLTPWGTAGGTHSGTPPPVSFTLNTQQHAAKVGAEIRMAWTVTNLSNRWVGIEPFYSPGINVKEVFSNKLAVKDSGGCPVAEREDYSIHRFLPGIESALRAKEVRTRDSTLSSVYDFSQPGIYTVQEILQDKSTLEIIASNVLTIAVFEDCTAYEMVRSSAEFSLAGDGPAPNGRIKPSQHIQQCNNTNEYEGVCSPVLIRQVVPKYTEDARRAELAGTVILDVAIDKVGKTGDVRVLQSLDKGLDEQAVAAVKQWKYKPALYKGEPIPANARVELEFGCRAAKYPPGPLP